MTAKNIRKLISTSPLDVLNRPGSSSGSAGIAALSQNQEVRTLRRLVDEPMPADEAGQLIAELRGLLLAEGDRDSQAISMSTTDE